MFGVGRRCGITGGLHGNRGERVDQRLKGGVCLGHGEVGLEFYRDRAVLEAANPGYV